MITRATSFLFQRLPPAIQAKLDIWRDSLNPHSLIRFEFGGPFNGQAGRRDIVRELFSSIAFDFVVETGAFRAVTTQFFLAATELPVYSVEIHRRFYLYCKWVLANQLPPEQMSRLHSEEGDSRTFLRSLERLKGIGLFYLDAHWRSDMPLWEEIQIIESQWPEAVIICDDFRVPGDEGYGFDDYGPDNRLAEENLPDPVWAQRDTYYPNLPSLAETGKKRGCVVLMPATLAREFTTLSNGTTT